MIRLPLRDELWLLGHNDDGQPRIHRRALCLGLAAAVLIEMVHAELLTVEYGRVRVVGPYRRTGDPIIDATTTDVATQTRRTLLPELLHRTASDLDTRIRGYLVAAGLLATVERRVLGLIPSIRHRRAPAGMLHTTRAAGRIRYLLTGTEIADPQATALCALVAQLRLEHALVLSTPSNELLSQLHHLARHAEPITNAIVEAAVNAISQLAVAVYR